MPRPGYLTIFGLPFYARHRFPPSVNGLYSMNKLGQLSVQPNWIDLKYKVKANAVARLRALNVI
jgi:hypothetical protein